MLSKSVLFPTCFFLCSVTAFSQAGNRPPKVRPAISPQSYSDFRYNNHLSNDFRFTDRFEIKNPVSVRVVIHGIEMTEGGYAHLIFSYIEEKPELERSLSSDGGFYRATLQTTDELKRLDIDTRALKGGVEAELTGWRATRVQLPHSELLVEEILLAGESEAFVLHRENGEMVKYRDKDKPRTDDEPSEKPEDGGG